MNSVSGSKERAVYTRNRKHGTAESYSTSKLATFTPEMWYRKSFQMCEDSRTGTRPAPEGAGSAPGSGTASPGSSGGSPGSSFSGSPGGSAGSSPGGSASGSSPGSSPGSCLAEDKGIWCENCDTRLLELKRQALKMMIPGAFSSKDPAFSALIHDKLQVPNTTRKAWNERDNRCDICATHLNQLKQEAIQMVQTLEQAATLEQYDPLPGSPPPLSNIPSLVGSRNIGNLQAARDWAFVPAAYAATTTTYAGFLTNKHPGKPNSLGIVGGAEKKGAPSGHAVTKAGLQMATSPSNGNILSSVAIQAHQYLEGTWSVSRTNGVTLYPYPISQLMSESCREGLTEAVLNRYNSDKPSVYSFPSSQGTYVSSVASSGTSAAASFFARAAQKLNLSSKKKKHHRSPRSEVSESPPFPTNFSGILQMSPPPAPPCLLRAINKVKDNPGMGKVKVMLRICSASVGDMSESSCFFKVDPRKKQITLYDPPVNGLQNSSQKRGGLVPPKMFAFDAVFPQDSSQAEVCAGTVAEVIQSVVNGADGCVFCFGHTKLGKSYTMIGKDDSMQNLGIIPCAISWLFKLINERKEKTGARFSVRVSAVEVWGKEENLKDLLSEVATGSLQDGQSPGVYLCEDPICGMQLQNQSELRAPTAEKAAFFLDAAIASRRSSRPECDEEDQRNSHMLFTLHIYQYRMEKSGKGGMSGGRSRLHLIDLGSCVKVLSKSREGGSGLCLSLSALGNVILALVNGTKHIPYKDSKLTMLLRESLGNLNCRTTMIGHISASSSHYSETLSTIQIASRVLRMKKKKTKYTSSSSGGESSCEEGRMRRPTQLRPFHPRGAADPDLPILNLSSEPDYSSSSEQSCDTVIYVGPNGNALSDKELTDNEGPPDFVPIIPSLQKNKNEVRPEGAAEPVAPLPEQDCLKCNTFAELQERLECIDGSEEPSKFPFEEVPVATCSEQPLGTEEAQAPSGGEAHQPSGLASADWAAEENPEETHPTLSRAQAAPSPVPLGSHGSGSAPSSPRSVMGSSTTQLNASRGQGVKDVPLSSGSAEAKPRPMGSPRLGVASLSKTSDYKPQHSPSQRCKVYTQKGSLPSPAPPPPQTLTKDCEKSCHELLEEPEIRTAPVGMSSQIMKRSVSSGTEYSQDSMFSDQEQDPADDPKQEMMATVTLQQPLELNGEDELVFTLVEELTISGILENGRPTSIISFNSDCSVQALASGSRPVSIISSINEDLDCYSNAAPFSEVNIAKFLPFPKPGLDEKVLVSSSRRSSISSWLSEMSEGEQSCHNFVAQACSGNGEALADPSMLDVATNLPEECVAYAQSGKYSVMDKFFAMPEKANETRNMYQTAPNKNCKIATLGKTTVRISNASGLSAGEGCFPIQTNISVHPCIRLKPIHLSDQVDVLSSVRYSPAHSHNCDVKSAGIYCPKEMKFDDPWLKREEGEEEEEEEEDVSLDGSDRAERGDQPTFGRNQKQSSADSLSSCETTGSPIQADHARRVVDGCEVALTASSSQSSIFSSDSAKAGSLSRALQHALLGKHDDPDGISLRSLSLATESGNNSAATSQASTPGSPKSTLERRLSSPKHGMLPRPKGMPPLPPVRKSSLDQRNRASPQHVSCSSAISSLASTPDEGIPHGRAKTPNMDNSSRAFSGKTEQFSSQTNSLNRRYAGQYECLSLERAGSLASVGAKVNASRDSTMPRTGRSLNRTTMSSPTHPGFPPSLGTSPKSSSSKMSAVSKLLLASPKSRSLSASSTKTLSFSTKSLPQSVGRSSSMPSNSKNMSWSTQSLSSKQSRASSLVAKLPLRAVNGRISELLQGTTGMRAGQLRGSAESDEWGAHAGEKSAPQPLPSPYSKVTPPRKPHRCSSGHGSDNSSVLSGELPPAMGKTALFYHSGGSSGYESMIRDSEATGSGSSAQDSMSENGTSVAGRSRSLKSPKRRMNTGSQRRRVLPSLSPDAAPPARKPANSSGVRWVDLRPVQRGLAEPFEIKVYEIDDVERLQRRRAADSKLRGFVCFNAKLKILEHRQQRISEVKTKYDILKKELEATKQRLMLHPTKWISEFDLDQGFEVDSLEYLEALECVTERLEHRVNFCKAHLMMITCFDIACGRR
ncbi:LOW QUALITY PROTEIN: kinesin-like protein KIF26B [Scyliorhinus canicula]|uniref:LOW QUALITY PROTEIN: kinesin-like protein KIF26B n=1 Tax=Scyliorhinus canicula TaxID=7830 RepID=UPI0018F6612A|nr:LOW QUALITY PROTEIN: kinesin-like protein KIF26B [Scyliorhinus canicula]